MGAVSDSIATAARGYGAEIITNAPVAEILLSGDASSGTGGGSRAVGVRMEDGTVLHAEIIISGASPYHTFMELLPAEAASTHVPEPFVRHIGNTGGTLAKAYSVLLAMRY